MESKEPKPHTVLKMKLTTNLFSVFLLTLALVVVFSPYLFQGKTFLPVDSYNMLYKPYSENHPRFEPYNHFEDDILKWYFQYKTYSQKYLYKPYWSPNAFGGIPWYANTYTSHFGTTNWMLKFGSVEKMYPLQLIFQLWIAGLGMFFFLKCGMRLSPQVSTIFALSFMLSSIFITLLMRWWLLGPFSWIPLLFYFLVQFWQKGGRRYFALSALFLAFAFLDGFLQSQAIVVMMLFTLSLSWWYWLERPRGFWRFQFGSLGILVCAIGLSAIMWFPHLEFLVEEMAKGSSRTSGDVFGKNVIQRLLSVPYLASLMVPQIIGSVRAFDFAKLINSHLQDFSAFIGLSPLFFGLCGILNIRKLEKKAIPFLVIAIVGLTIPIFSPLDRYVYFRFFVVYVTGICILGAISLEHFLNKGGEIYSKIQSGFFTIFTLIFLGVIGFNLFIYVKGDWFRTKAEGYIIANLNSSTIGSRNPEWMLARIEKTIDHFSFTSPTMYLPLICGVGFFLVLNFFRKKYFGKNVFLALMGIITFLELSFFAHSWLPRNDPKKFPFYEKNYVTDFLLENQGSYRSTVDDWNGSDQRKQKQILPTNSQVIYGYKTIEGFDGMSPRVIYNIPVSANEYKKLGLLNVKYILTNPEPIIVDPSLKLLRQGVVAIYENKLAKSRGRVLYNYEVVKTNQETLSKLSSNSYDGNTVFFSKEPEFQKRSNAPFIETLIKSESDNNIAYEIETKDSGYFVASETYYPGWKAVLNGKPVEVLRGNYAMRVVPVPPGKHLLEFRFEPEIYYLGLKVSAFFFLIFLFLLICPPVGFKLP